MSATSAFHPATPPGQPEAMSEIALVLPQAVMNLYIEAGNRDTMESETEDEEVKRNCVGGIRAIDDSDINSTDGGDDDDNDDDDGGSLDGDRVDLAERNQGVVTFVSKRIPALTTFPLIRPKPKALTRPRLSPHDEAQEREDDVEDKSCESDSSHPSIGARGISLSLGTPSALSEAGEDDDGEDDEGSDAVESEDSEDESVTSSSSADQQEDSRSIGTEDALADIVDDQNDDEVSDILQSLGEELTPELDDADSSERFIGVMEDRDDLVTVPKAKRVLSYNTLSMLNIESRGIEDSPKRVKLETCGHPLTLLSSFSLGPPAIDLNLPLLSDAMGFKLSMREQSPIISSSDEEEELDRRLGAELRDQGPGVGNGSGDTTPVPLLTPPGSPLTVELNGHTTTVCEWPSNLAVDSAMTAASELRPMSPGSLEDLERREFLRRSDASTLTPLLRGIYVGKT